MNRNEDHVNGSAIRKVYCDHTDNSAGRLVNPIEHYDSVVANTDDNGDSDNDNDNKAAIKQSQKKTGASQQKQDSDIPKRPLSAYNLFFQLERENILKGEEDQNYTYENVARIALIHYQQCRFGKPKRKHRKSHGVISFRELARVIAIKWKKLDDFAKQLFEERAAIEKALYQKEVDEITKIKCQTQTESPSQLDTDQSERVLDAELAAPSEPFEESIIKNLVHRNEEMLKAAPQGIVTPGSQSSRPIYFESNKAAARPKPRVDSLSPSLFQPVPDDYNLEPLALSDSVMMRGVRGSDKSMRSRPQQWDTSSSQEYSGQTEQMQHEYNNHSASWPSEAPAPSRSTTGRQRRRNSTSFYPIDHDEKVDIIQLNDSFLENRESTIDDGMSEAEEETAMTVMLASFENNGYNGAHSSSYYPR